VEGRGAASRALPLLDVDQLKERQAEFRVVDTREGFEYRFGHIPASELLEWTESWEAMARVADDKPLALVCGDSVAERVRRVGAAAVRQARQPGLRRHGDWNERGYPVEKTQKEAR